jgi:hypothetical protein
MFPAFDPDKPEIRTKLSSLNKSGIIDPRLCCLCEFRSRVKSDQWPETPYHPTSELVFFTNLVTFDEDDTQSFLLSSLHILWFSAL